ncbi:hypothetical protein ACG3RN_13340 [Pseudomonas aeruginosa]
MNVKSRQQEDAEATREALLESALSTFIEHGYGGVSHRTPSPARRA